MYNAQLSTLEVKQQVNIMSEIEKVNVKIISISNLNDIITVKSYLKIDCYDYVIDNKTNKVLRGNDRHKARIEYLVTLVKDINNKKIVKCPDCGAEVEVTSSGRCKYCKSVLVQTPSDYVMSKKELIGQRILYHIDRSNQN